MRRRILTTWNTFSLTRTKHVAVVCHKQRNNHLCCLLPPSSYRKRSFLLDFDLHCFPISRGEIATAAMSTFRLHSVSGGGNNPTFYQQPLCEFVPKREFGVRAALLMSAGAAFGNIGDMAAAAAAPIVPPREVFLPTVIVKGFNNFILPADDAQLPDAGQLRRRISDLATRPQFKPFVVGGYQVGLISCTVLQELTAYPQTFVISDVSVTLADNLDNYESRSVAIAEVLLDMRNRDAFVTLRGWRNECFEVRVSMEEPSLMQMERSATCLFGIRQYGVDISGYVNHPEKGLCIWMQKRSPSKSRWPGMWDNMVGGGLATGYTVLQTAHKEGTEEASIPEEELTNLQPVGSVSIFFESERGLSPNTEFVYDLELPVEFDPTNQDGEVSEFQLVPAMEALEMVLSTSFKTTSRPVALDFLIRHGVLTDAMEPELERIRELLHIPLDAYYHLI